MALQTLEVPAELPHQYFYCCVARQILLTNGDGEIRTLDPLLARQVLSQLSYAPISLTRSLGSVSGLKWTRTTDLTLIRRAL